MTLTGCPEACLLANFRVCQVDILIITILILIIIKNAKTIRNEMGIKIYHYEKQNKTPNISTWKTAVREEMVGEKKSKNYSRNKFWIEFFSY